MKAKLIFFLKVFLGVLFILTALGKLLDNRGFAKVLESYQLIPTALTLVIALCISLFELILGVAIFFRNTALRAGWGMCFMNFGYTVLALVTNLRDIRLENCGCFGVFLPRPMTWGTVWEDLFLTVVTAFFCGALRSKPSGAAEAILSHEDSPNLS